MKRLIFSRKSILRAIQAAWVALFLAAAASKSQAQVFTQPFVINGSDVSTDANGTFTSPVGFYDNVNAYSSITIGSGVTINSSSTYGGFIMGQYSAVIGTATSSLVNNGSLNLNTTSGNYLDTIGLNQGAISVQLTNTGSITSTGLAGVLNLGSAIYVTSTSGNTSLDNSGTISSTGGNSQYAVWFQSTDGNLSVTNEQTGHITGDKDYPLYLQSSGSGAITVTNDGIIDSPSSAVVARSSTGAIQVTNNGTLNLSGNGSGVSARSDGGITAVNNGHIVGTNSNSGIYAEGVTSNSGAISLTNTGSISGTSFGLGVQQSGSGTIRMVNSGDITASYSAIYGYFDNPNTTASSFYIRNTGSLTSTGSGIYAYSPVTVYNSGNITAPTAINLPSGSSLTLAGRPIINGTIIGGANSSSTSTLSFNLTIPAANLAAAQGQLNTELAAYATQNGGSYTFTVDGLTFDISNFAFNGITDDLAAEVAAAAARQYELTPGYQSMGTVLDHFDPNNARASTILTALGNVPDAGVANALGELSPKALQVFTNVANNVATFNAAKINNHLANRRDGLTGFDATALNVQDSSMDPSLNQVRDHLLAYSPVARPGVISDSVEPLFGGMDMKSEQVNTMPTDRWSSFIAGDVILADLSHNANLENANYTTGNVTAGLDYRLDEHFTVGALFAYAHTDASLDSRGSSATVDSYSPGLYASYVDKGWYGNGLATYGRNAYTSDRMVDIPGIAGDNHGGTNGNQGTINLTGGYEFQKGAFKFGPVASVQYVHLAVDSMQEQGPAALTIASQDQDSFRSQLGVEGRFAADVNTPFGPMGLTPHLSLSWQHEYLDNSRGINAQFTGTGGGSFVTSTDNPDRDAAFIDVGLDAEVAKNVTLFVDYETQAGQQNYFAQSAQGGVKIGF